MGLLDFFTDPTGERALRRVRDRSIEATRTAYDPSVLEPQVDVARRQASQGIDEDTYRRSVLNQLFRPAPDMAVYGGNQAAAIAGAARQGAAQTQAISGFESQLAMQDIEARNLGAERLGTLTSQQLQIGTQRKAQIETIQAQFEAERDARQRELMGSLVGFGVAALGGPTGVASLVGGGIGAAGSFVMDPKATLARLGFGVTNPTPAATTETPLQAMRSDFSRPLDQLPTAPTLPGPRVEREPESARFDREFRTEPRQVPTLSPQEPIPGAMDREAFDRFLRRREIDDYIEQSQQNPNERLRLPLHGSGIPQQLPGTGPTWQPFFDWLTGRDRTNEAFRRYQQGGR